MIRRLPLGPSKAPRPPRTLRKRARDSAIDNVGIAGYRLYQGESLHTTVTSTVYNVTDLKPGTAYTFKVEAMDAAGNRSHNGLFVTFTTRADVTAR
ncbi:fibronectin type III domain-containing protein [Paenibacillus allorhizosphaerae]|uniref:fibronectin type III domain-containing protein n=1 Tax=Paenibacillus allorhizosphaerae TaxID=2849866 RepID=UPI0036244792